MPIKNVFHADKIFNGDEWLNDHAIITGDGIIEQVIPLASVPGGFAVENFPGCFIAPAFIDLQIYGAAKKLFAVYPEPDSLAKLRDHVRSGGAVYCLPTVATNQMKVFHKCIDAVREYWRLGGDGILGLHIEGPWINPVKRGAHIESLIHPPTMDEAKELLAYGKDVIKMITLAPETCSPEVIRLVQSQNIIVSAGHSNASYSEAMDGFSKGIKTATHLYNAMSALQHRAPGLVGAIFNDEKVMCSVIADGHHVDYAAIRIAKKIMGPRLFAITDAVTETTAGYYQHYLAGDKYEAGGILSGSSLNMAQALKNLVQQVNVDLGEGLRMCSLYPAKVAGLQERLGKIGAGYEAKLVVMNEDFDMVKLIS